MKYADRFLKYDEEYTPKHNIHYYHYHGECLEGKYHEVIVPSEELFEYREGALIQDALVSVSDTDKEFLLSGGCCIEWE